MPIDDRSKNGPGPIVYISGDGAWRRLSARLWLAPNGDTVSVRSMTLELRIRLGIADDELETGTNQKAITAVREILDR